MFKLLLQAAMVLAVLGVSLLVLATLLTTRFLPDERIAVGKVGAVVTHRERCWEGCTRVASGRVTFRGRNAMARLFPQQPGLGGMLHMSQALAFPGRGMLVTILGEANTGHIVAGIGDGGKAPVLTVLAGGLDVDGRQLVRAGADAGLARRALDYANLGYARDPARYYPGSGFSFHDRFWIDYAAEEVHPVVDQRYVGLAEPVGLTADRKTLLLLYPLTTAPGTYMLCSASGPDGVGQCAVFEASSPLPQSAPVPVPLPVPSIGMHVVDADAQAARVAAWLAPTFVLDRVGPEGQILVRPGVEVMKHLRLPTRGNPAGEIDGEN